MLVPVVHVRVMRVVVFERLVFMRMGMGFVGRFARRVSMLMVRVMLVAVVVYRPLVYVGVFMPLGQVQPQANSHEQSGRDERQSHWVTQDNQGHRRPHERGGREVRPRPG